MLHDFAKADHAWLEPLLGAIAAEAPYLAEGASDKFQSRVAHAVQAEAAEKPAPRTKPARAARQGAQPPRNTSLKAALAEKLRRWFGA